MMKLIVAFRDFANAPKIIRNMCNKISLTGEIKMTLACDSMSVIFKVGWLHAAVCLFGIISWLKYVELKIETKYFCVREGFISPWKLRIRLAVPFKVCRNCVRSLICYQVDSWYL
jgi:hypothetical protein